MPEKYHPEPYWSEVAGRIAARENGNVIAGDDEPYYRYKRKRFLELLHSVDFSGKSVLEIGCGPGGNLLEVWKQQPSRLEAVDISQSMIDLARSKVPGEIAIHKVNGTELPFPDQHFDLVFTATVLQHNTDEKMLASLVKEIARVSKKEVFLFERIEAGIVGDELCFGRPVSYYEGLMKTSGFHLKETKFINVRTSFYLAGTTRKLLNPKER